MKKRMKKLISLLLAVVIVLTASSIGMISYGALMVCPINEAYFPDANFRAVVSDWYDTNGDGHLDSDEVNGVTFMTLSYMVEETCGENAQIQDLTGIKYFKYVKRLRVSNLGLQKVDVSALTDLVELTIQGNELSEIDLSKNTKLETLNIASNNLTKLNMYYNTSLTKVYAYANNLTSVSYPSNASTNLTTLRLDQNEFTSLDVSSLTALTELNVSHNHLRSLDLSQNVNLGNVTSAFIGSQRLSAQARIDMGNIFVQFDIPNWNTNVVSTTVDIVTETEEGGTLTQLGYDGLDFTPQDCDNIVNGITYYYDTGLANAESMDVNIDVERDFWQVKYFTGADKTALYKKEIVYTGNNATPPENIEIPQCKRFVQWSASSDNITSDREIYAVWADDHNVVVVNYLGGIFDFNCTKCYAQESDYSFVDYLNMRNDMAEFPTLLDQNNDGIINAKDYAILKRALK